MRYYLLIILFISTAGFGQTGVNTVAPNANAEMHVVSPTNDKGVLFPRMNTAAMNLIAGGTPTEGMIIFNTDINTFCYYNGTQWTRIGNACTLLADNNVDTKVQVEKNANEDKVRFDTFGTEIAVVDQTGFTQEVGDLSTPVGTVTINNYSLPTVDGSNKFVLTTNGSGTLSWKDPLTLPGLVAGVQTYPLGAGREYEPFAKKAFFTVIVPWSNMTISKITVSINVAAVGNIFEVGIYDNTTLVRNGTYTAVATGIQFVEIPLSSSYSLTAGKLYRFAIADRNNSTSSMLESPIFHSLNWNEDYSSSSTPYLLPATATKTILIQKIVWFCAY